jgi:hypothetical protein
MNNQKTESFGRASPNNYISTPLSMPEPWLVWDKNNKENFCTVNSLRWCDAIETGCKMLSAIECDSILWSKAVILLSKYV